MRRVAAVLLAGALASGAGVTSTHGAQPTTQSHHVADWGQRDTATYVVSTLNLIRTRNGQPLPSAVTQRMGVVRFNVYHDTADAESDLYFVQLRRDDDSVAGVLAYQMGWWKPRGVTSFPAALGISRSPSDVIHAYKSDPKQLLGSFTSTVPS